MYELAGMTTGFFLVAAGAILRYAVTVEVGAIDLQVTGLVLLFVGMLMIAIWLFLWASSWWGWGPGYGPGRSERPADRFEERTRIR